MNEPRPNRPWWKKKQWRAMGAALIVLPIAFVSVAAVTLSTTAIDRYLANAFPLLRPVSPVGRIFWFGAFGLLGAAIGVGTAYALRGRRNRP